MSTHVSRQSGLDSDEVRDRLHAVRAARRPIIGSGAGTGLSAKAAALGGADLILVYNSGRFRMAGHGSNAGTLPLGDANAIVMEMGTREVLPIVEDTPVIAGVNGADPTRVMSRFLEAVQAAGFSGVINFPTMGIIDGRWRQSLEETGFSYAREVLMIGQARELGLFTMAYTFTDEEARQMAATGVDVVVTHLGTTVGGTVGADPGATLTLDDAVRRTEAMAQAARKERPDIFVLTHGGPIATPQDVHHVLARTTAHGFVGASTMERIPVERAIRETLEQFKSVAMPERP